MRSLVTQQLTKLSSTGVYSQNGYIFLFQTYTSYSMSKPLLISFNICPYVIRAAALMFYKGIDFEIKYVDLRNKPEWFLQISPFGKVPVLQIGDKVLFESTAIIEYIDETNPPSLHPADPIQRAINRGYYQLATDFLTSSRDIFYAKDRASFEQGINGSKALVQKLENLLQPDTKFFNGNDIAPIDFVFAPNFLQLFNFQNLTKINLFENAPKSRAYGENLVALESVQKSIVPDYYDAVRAFSKAIGSYYLTLTERPLLISFALCPYVQRVRTLLEQKKVEYDIKFVDLQNKPEWFLKLSPLGKVPVLQVGDKVIFESSVILEYIDESYGPTLLPKTPLERADTRAWIVFANELQNAYVTLWKSKDPADIEPTIEKGDKLLAILEARLQGENPFFYGNHFTLVDSVYAPVFQQVKIIQDLLKRDFYAKFPKVKAYASFIVTLPEFTSILPAQYHEQALEILKRNDAAIAKL